MSTLTLRFHGQLSGLLPRASRGRPIVHTVGGTPAVKDVIESLGVPHVEIGRVTVDGGLVGLGHRVHDGEQVDVYPAPVGQVGLVPAAMGPATGDRPMTRFVLDGHLGRLAAYLRMLGFDCVYSNRADDGALADLASSEGRILLTRDRALLKRSIVRHGYLVRSDRSEDQLREVVARFGLGSWCRPFGRCLRCNGLLEPIAPEAARARVPPRVASEQHEFRQCQACDALYWRGSHHARMVRLIERVVPEALATPAPESARLT